MDTPIHPRIHQWNQIVVAVMMFRKLINNHYAKRRLYKTVIKTQKILIHHQIQKIKDKMVLVIIEKIYLVEIANHPEDLDQILLRIKNEFYI